MQQYKEDKSRYAEDAHRQRVEEIEAQRKTGEASREIDEPERGKAEDGVESDAQRQLDRRGKKTQHKRAEKQRQQRMGYLFSYPPVTFPSVLVMAAASPPRSLMMRRR